MDKTQHYEILPGLCTACYWPKVLPLISLLQLQKHQVWKASCWSSKSARGGISTVALARCVFVPLQSQFSPFQNLHPTFPTHSVPLLCSVSKALVGLASNDVSPSCSPCKCLLAPLGDSSSWELMKALVLLHVSPTFRNSPMFQTILHWSGIFFFFFFTKLP